jgi:hypothetical protein
LTWVGSSVTKDAIKFEFFRIRWKYSLTFKPWYYVGRYKRSHNYWNIEEKKRPQLSQLKQEDTLTTTQCASGKIHNSNNSQKQKFPQQKHLTHDDGHIGRNMCI